MIVAKTKNKTEQSESADPVEQVDPVAMAPAALPQDSVVQKLTVSIEAPVHYCAGGYTTSWFSFRATMRQAAAIKVLWSSLSDLNERFDGGHGAHPDGTTVNSAAQGLRWLLDRLADEIEAETGKQLLQDFDLTFH